MINGYSQSEMDLRKIGCVFSVTGGLSYDDIVKQKEFAKTRCVAERPERGTSYLEWGTRDLSLEGRAVPKVARHLG